MEEVAREGARSLGSEELGPRWPRCPRCRPEAVTAQDVAYTGRRDGHTELAALPHDAGVALTGVLFGQTQNKGNDLVAQGVGRGPVMSWVGPGPSDELPVPAQQRGRRDQERCPALSV